MSFHNLLFLVVRYLPIEFLIWSAHIIGIIKAYRLRNSKGLKLHLGCGRVIKRGWVNIDLNRMADLTLDFRRKLPLSDESSSIIYSEHFLEHLEYPNDVERLLSESYRVLQEGGIFSVGVPDTERPLKAYFESDSDYFRYVKGGLHPKWCVTRMEHINYHFRQDGEHKFAYDFDTLKHVLEKAGFVGIRRREFNPSLDSQEGSSWMLYVDAFKPFTKKPVC